MNASYSCSDKMTLVRSTAVRLQRNIELMLEKRVLFALDPTWPNAIM
jgi:hypothetical protein